MLKIISFSSLIHRLKYIEPFLLSIKNQILKPDKIILNVDHKSEIFIKKNIFLIDLIKKYNVEILSSKHDLGPFMKLGPSYAKFKRNSIIVTADDDMLYPPEWFKGLYDFMMENSDTVVCYRGRKINNAISYNQTELIQLPKKPIKVDIITGVYGVAYNTNNLNSSILDIKKYNKEFLKADDIWISYFLKKFNIIPMAIPFKSKIKSFIEYDMPGVKKLWYSNKIHPRNTNLMKKYLLNEK